MHQRVLLLLLTCSCIVLALFSACSDIHTPEPIVQNQATDLTLVTTAQNWFTHASYTTSRPVAINWKSAQTTDEWVVAPLADTTNFFASEHKQGCRYLVVKVAPSQDCVGYIVELVVEGKRFSAAKTIQLAVAATQQLLVAPQSPVALEGFTGYIMLYSSSYKYENGFVYAHGIAQPKRVRIVPRKAVARVAKTNESTPASVGMDGEAECPMVLVCGYFDGSLSNCIYMPKCESDGPGGGGGGDGGWGGGGSGGGVNNPNPNTTTTPCGALTITGQDSDVKAQFNSLAGLVTDNKEHGLGLYYDQAGNPQFASVTGQPGAAGINLSITGTLTSFTHTHYTGLLSVFSPDDMQTMWTLYSGGNMTNPSTFTMNLITASGTVYALAISDISAFQAFGNNTFSSPSTFSAFNFAYGSLYNIDPSKTVAQNESAFLQLLTQSNTGLALYKGDPTNFASWQKLSYDNNTQTTSSTPCP